MTGIIGYPMGGLPVFGGPIGSPYPMMPMIDLPPPEDALPPEWTAGVDKTGNKCSYSKELNVSQWTPPGVVGLGGGLANGGGGPAGFTLPFPGEMMFVILQAPATLPFPGVIPKPPATFLR